MRKTSSQQKNRLWIGVLCILSSACLSCCGQLLWKLAAGAPALLLGGLALYGLGALGMLFAFRFGELSVLHPMLSMGYVFSLLLGRAVLHEPLSATRLLGVFVIMVGVFLLTRAGREEG